MIKPILLSVALLHAPMLFHSLTAAELTFATYNVSMEAENYVPSEAQKDNSEQILVKELASGTKPADPEYRQYHQNRYALM
jgi:hypothetical protein